MAKHILTCRASIALHQDGAVIAAIRRFQTMLPTIPQAHGPGENQGMISFWWNFRMFINNES
jgi:hypothetical protein